MKTLTFNIALANILFFASTNLGYAASPQSQGLVDEWEYRILKEQCRRIISHVESRCYTPRGVHITAIPKMAKAEISDHLFARGTPTARKIYAEYEDIGWKYPDIKNI